jgi:hypothetical protein
VSVSGDFTFKRIRSQLGRLFNKFEGELGGMERINAVELDNSVLEEVKF